MIGPNVWLQNTYTSWHAESLYQKQTLSENLELELLLAESFWMEPTGNSNERPGRQKVSVENCEIYVHFVEILI